MDQPLVSIIILTFNHAPYIDGCLRSVFGQTYTPLEVIVFDNASTDGTADRVRRSPWAAGVRLIESPRNLGCAGGNNRASRQARGAALVFLNPDTQLDEGCVAELVRPLFERKDVGITGAKIYYPNSRRFQHAGGIIHRNGMCAHRGEGELDRGQFDVPAEVDYVTGAALAVRRDLFLYLRGFDEDYNPAYYEESDLCWRARRCGYKVLYVPTAVLWHKEGAALTKWSAAFYWLNYRNRIRFLMKNYSLWRWLTWFLPQEIQWYRYREARGHRLLQLRAYGAGLAFAAGKLLRFFSISRSNRSAGGGAERG
ncbi:MAG: hypothetical protein Kow0059_01150 [Candidatus Sumerlaeia bacterium]